MSFVIDGGMASAAGAGSEQSWKQGLVIIILMVLGGGVGAGGLYLAEIPYGLIIGAILGAIVMFLVYSYIVYGR